MYMIKKAVVDAKVFSEGLDQVSRVLQNTVFPALSEVYVRIQNGICILTATNMDTWLIREIPAQGDNLAFVMQRTKDVAKACRMFDGSLSLELEKICTGKKSSLKLVMRCASRAAEFEAMDPEDYPEYKPFEVESAFSVNAGDLLARINRVGYAALKPSVHTQVNRSSVQFSGQHVFAVDGNRMACDTDPDFSFPRPFMAYEGTVSHLKLFGDRDVVVEFGNGRICFRNGVITLDFHIPSMDIFPVDKVIPQNSTETFSLSPKDFLKELKYLKEFAAKERYPYVRFSGGELFMPTSSGKYSTAVEITGENRIIFAFDLHRMIEAVRQFKDEKCVTLKINSAVSPILIQAEGRNDLALVCPARLTDKLAAA